MKKTSFLFAILILTILSSCRKSDDLRPEGCYLENKNTLRLYNTIYNDDMTDIVDANGNGQSLEACLLRRQRTIDFINQLTSFRTIVSNEVDYGCYQGEVDSLLEDIDDRIRELNEDMESTWNRCEEVYGSGG